jgi:hypothetical protein
MNNREVVYLLKVVNDKLIEVPYEFKSLVKINDWFFYFVVNMDVSESEQIVCLKSQELINFYANHEYDISL